MVRLLKIHMKEDFNTNFLIEALDLKEAIGDVFVNYARQLDDIDDVLFYCEEMLLNKPDTLPYKTTGLKAMATYVKEKYIIDDTKTEVAPLEEYIQEISEYIEIVSLKSANEGVIWYSNLVLETMLSDCYIKTTSLIKLKDEYERI